MSSRHSTLREEIIPSPGECQRHDRAIAPPLSYSWIPAKAGMTYGRAPSVPSARMHSRSNGLGITHLR